MLLQEIIDSDMPVGELADLVKTFPRTWEKMVEKLRNKPHRLKFAGFDIYDETGFGPAIDGATNAFREQMAKGNINVEVTFDLGHMQDFDTVQVKDANHVWTGYDPKNDRILLGYDAWIDEEDFAEKFAELFEKEFGEDFDYDDNDEHQAIYNRAVKKFHEVGFFGLLVMCNFDGMKPMCDVEREGVKGFFKGLAPHLGHAGYIDL